MAKADTILDDLTGRMNNYRTPQGTDRNELPITLNEMAWLAQKLYGTSLVMPRHYRGRQLRLVAEIFEPRPGTVVVKP